MSSTSTVRRPVACVAAGIVALAIALGGSQAPASHDLVKLFHAFMAFERPQSKSGAPDYTAAAIAARRIKDRAHQLGDGFTMRRFFEEFNAAGVIPVPLIRRQMSGARQ